MRVIKDVTPQMATELKRLRVCAYARVSSGKDAMLHSLSAQVSYYQKFIASHIDWQFCGIYADEAFTGTKEVRPQFQKMLEECRNGNIDLVVTKSISRFARNTITLLQTVRELKAMGVDVFFEEQNIHTLSADGELMLSILASYAQEESLSASENQKWRIRKSFEAGKITAAFPKLFGYRVVKGKITIDEETAPIVRKIFSQFANGASLAEIAHWLTDNGVPCIVKGEWSSKKVKLILSNEKYSGNALLQKTFRNNHLEKRKIVNRGHLPQYFVEDTHPAIVDMVTYQIVKERLQEASDYFTPTTPQSDSPFSKMMFCGYCGEYVKRAKNNARTVWNCHRYLEEGKAGCEGAKQIRNDMLEELCCEVFGWESLDEEFIRKNVVKIKVFAHKLTFEMADGASIEKEWKNKSRSASWTPEMRERARQRAIIQHGG
ncbi:MAG: recombinase family protein [Clostridia bacterium]|nr:recombinase family protein [Clostridia bacterium]